MELEHSIPYGRHPGLGIGQQQQAGIAAELLQQMASLHAQGCCLTGAGQRTDDDGRGLGIEDLLLLCRRQDVAISPALDRLGGIHGLRSFSEGGGGDDGHGLSLAQTRP